VTACFFGDLAAGFMRRVCWPGRSCWLVLGVLCSIAPASASEASVEKEGPYAVRVLGQGLVLEIFGTFSWALPQQLGVALVDAPDVRIIQLTSNGGHIKAALEVADIIQSRGLDTFVPRMCASACTIAFLAGHRRFVTETAQLGFHQGHGPGISVEQGNLMLTQAYQRFSLPQAFLAHVLRTSPQDLWVPDLAELRTAGIITAVAPQAAPAVPPPGVPREVTESAPAVLH
jgi:hypothetical protein